MVELNTMMSQVAQHWGVAVGQSIKTQIESVLNTTDVDVQALQDKINTIQSILDADPGTPEFDIATNIITQLTDIKNRITANEAAVTTLNGADTVAGSVSQKVKVETDRALAAEALLASDIASANANTTVVAGDLAAEIVRATAAEGVNATAIATEASRAANAEATNASAITAETARATSVEGNTASLLTTDKTNLVSAINEVITSTATARTGIRTDLSAEEAARIAGDADLQGQINTLATTVTGDISTALAAEESARIAADTALAGDIASEASARQGADASIQAELDATQAGSGLDIDGSYVVKADANYINGATSLHSATVILDGAVKSNAHSLAAEVTRAVTAEQTNATAIVNESLTRSAEDASLQAQIDSLSGGGTGSVTSLQEELDATQLAVGVNANGTYAPHVGSNYVDTATSTKNAITLLDAQSKVNSDAVATEATRALSAEGTLQSNINAEADARTAADTTLSNAIAAEAATRASKDGDLTTLTTTNKSNLVAAINEVASTAGAVSADLQTSITNVATDLATEAATRSTNDTALQAELDATQAGAGLSTSGAYVATAGTNYIATAVSLVDADNKLDTQMKVNADAITALQAATTGDTASLQAQLDAETAARTLADSTLTADLATEVARATGVEAGIQTTVNTLNGDVTTVGSVAKAVNDAVTAEATTRQTADALLQSQIDANATANTTVAADLATEVARATAAEGVNASAISAETTRATTAEALLEANKADKTYVDTTFATKADFAAIDVEALTSIFCLAIGAGVSGTDTVECTTGALTTGDTVPAGDGAVL
jgi:hypothetical protein